MDAGGDLGSAAKGSAIGLEVVGSGPVTCHFFIPFFSLPCIILLPVYYYYLFVNALTFLLNAVNAHALTNSLSLFLPCNFP